MRVCVSGVCVCGRRIHPVAPCLLCTALFITRGQRCCCCVLTYVSARRYPLEKFVALLANEARKASRDGALEFAVKEGFAGAKQGNKSVVLDGAGSSDPQSARYTRHIFASFQTLAKAFPDEQQLWAAMRPAVMRVVCPRPGAAGSMSNAATNDGSASLKVMIPAVLQVRGLECMRDGWRCATAADGATLSAADLDQAQQDAQVCANAVVRGPWSVTVAALQALKRVFQTLPASVFACVGSSQVDNTKGSTDSTTTTAAAAAAATHRLEAAGGDGLAAGVIATETALASQKFSKVRVAAISTAVAFAHAVRDLEVACGGGGTEARGGGASAEAGGAPRAPSQFCVDKAAAMLRATVALRHDGVPAVAAAATRAMDALREKNMLPSQRAASPSSSLPSAASAGDF